jgi:UDP-N-acetylmuramoyl-L-alanyl-D-glutamate--2,6-diaminopimelate ligase
VAKRHGIACLLERLGLSAQLEPGSADLHITGIAFDSREVRPGYAFVCIVGEHVDGNQYIPEAVSRGAACIFSERKAPACAIPYFQVADVRQLLAELAADFYGQPSLKLRVLGVTGTNGKTTTTHLVDYILNYAGLKSGLIGTLGARLPGFDVYQNVKHTTPQSSDLYNSLAQMAESGCSHVCMEVSSHALSQKRVAGCHFASACLTNITQDHLDFHQTMENYWQSKRLLFSQLNDSRQQNKSAVINLDEPLAPEFLKVLNSSRLLIPGTRTLI